MPVVTAPGLNQVGPMTACSNDDIASPMYFSLIFQISALFNEVVAGLTL
jgi:hypothetical protein